MMKGTHLSIKLEKGSVAPRYSPNEWKEVEPVQVVITERGTELGLPLVDFQMVDADGKKYFFMITGRLISSLTAAIAGVNIRNHGKAEP